MIPCEISTQTWSLITDIRGGTNITIDFSNFNKSQTVCNTKLLPWPLGRPTETSVFFSRVFKQRSCNVFIEHILTKQKHFLHLFFKLANRTEQLYTKCVLPGRKTVTNISRTTPFNGRMDDGSCQVIDKRSVFAIQYSPVTIWFWRYGNARLESTKRRLGCI